MLCSALSARIFLTAVTVNRGMVPSVKKLPFHEMNFPIGARWGALVTWHHWVCANFRVRPLEMSDWHWICIVSSEWEEFANSDRRINWELCAALYNCYFLLIGMWWPSGGVGVSTDKRLPSIGDWGKSSREVACSQGIWGVIVRKVCVMSGSYFFF
jgi:hypothetical protein